MTYIEKRLKIEKEIENTLQKTIVAIPFFYAYQSDTLIILN
jgi:hypothetical protein